jgi:hypothetical protein
LGAKRAAAASGGSKDKGKGKAAVSKDVKGKASASSLKRKISFPAPTSTASKRHATNPKPPASENSDSPGVSPGQVLLFRVRPYFINQLRI